MESFQQTPKQRRIQKKKLEKAKREFAHSTPIFDPRESWTPRKKVGGVPVATLQQKQHSTPDYWRW